MAGSIGGSSPLRPDLARAVAEEPKSESSPVIQDAKAESRPFDAALSWRPAAAVATAGLTSSQPWDYHTGPDGSMISVPGSNDVDVLTMILQTQSD